MKQWQSLMAAEEKRTGLPAGLLSSLVQQETGGQQRFLNKPDDFHYGADAGGKRKSSARGLGGILEGTARDPGYGVTPLKDWSVPEQLRFMADYSQARIKQAGSLQGGLAAYGEGSKYGQQVVGRLGKDVPQAPVQVAQQPLAMPDQAFAPEAVVAAAPQEMPVNPYVAPEVVALQEIAPVMQAQAAQRPVPLPAAAPVDPDEWRQFQSLSTPMQMADLNYGNKRANPAASRPNLAAMQGWKEVRA